MNSNTYSSEQSTRPVGRFAPLVDALAAEDLDRLPDVALAEQVLVLRQQVDRLEGQWLQRLAAVDARGAAGADHGTQAPSTASWLRGRLHLGASTAASAVRTARALFRGPLTTTAQALCAGELSAAHASVLAHGTSDLPDHVAAEAEPILVEAARRLDPPRLRRVLGHLHLVADPDGASSQAERRHGRRGLWLAPPGRAWSPSTACSTPRPARPCWPPWRPGPPGQRRGPPQQRPAPRRRPDRTRPARPGGRPAAPDRRGPPPADRRCRRG
jgi:hypothetical protein